VAAVKRLSARRGSYVSARARRKQSRRRRRRCIVNEGGRPSNVTSPRETPSMPLQPGRALMKLFRVRARRRKTDNWLQRRKSGARDGHRPEPDHPYTTGPPWHGRSAPAFRSFSARSPITDAVKQRLRLKAAELLARRYRRLSAGLPRRSSREPIRSVTRSGAFPIQLISRRLVQTNARN